MWQTDCCSLQDLHPACSAQREGMHCSWSYIRGQGASNRVTKLIKINLSGDYALVIVFSLLLSAFDVLQDAERGKDNPNIWIDSSPTKIQEFSGLLENGLREEGREGTAKGTPGRRAQDLQGQGSWNLALASGASSWPWTSLPGEENTCATCSGQIIPLLPTEQQRRNGYL